MGQAGLQPRPPTFRFQKDLTSEGRRVEQEEEEMGPFYSSPPWEGLTQCVFRTWIGEGIFHTVTNQASVSVSHPSLWVGFLLSQA